MSSSRRSDYGEEFVERLRRDRFKKAFIFVNGVSSEEDEELDFEDEDDEMASFALGPSQHQPPRPPSTHSSRRSVAVSHNQRIGGAYGFDARDLYFFGVLTELTDKFTPERSARIIARNPPPSEYRTLVSSERIAYLFYYSLYGRYLNVEKFHNVFNREFYKYTSSGDSERNAFLKICRHTLEEYKRRLIEQNKRAYKMTQKHLFSDERATPDSRASDRPSVCADGSEDLNSLDSLAKELLFYRSPHMPVCFAPGGRIVFVDPDASMSTVCIEDTKKFYRDSEGRRYVEMMESFKGPLIIGHTPSQTPLLFIQRQINRILKSDVFQANPLSGDANDCLLIWHLLEMLICQQGKVTGPDLARLLCSKKPYSSFSNQNFLYSNKIRGQSNIIRQNSSESTLQEISTQAMDKVTQFLLGGHLEEAIDSAINDGLLFDALLLAHRLFRNDQRRLEAIETRLMAYRSPQHPITTLISVAADMPVPLLNNPTTDDANGWRAHIAIVLANLQTQTAMNAVYNLGLTLAQKEFNSAADFCFLAVNLLTGHNCFQPPTINEINEQTNYRKYIRLISASLPDDEMNSSITRFGWSILDYQATEIYDYALQLRNNTQHTALAMSNDYISTRKQYSQLLNELGGFNYSFELYNAAVLQYACASSESDNKNLKKVSLETHQMKMHEDQMQHLPAAPFLQQPMETHQMPPELLTQLPPASILQPQIKAHQIQPEFSSPFPPTHPPVETPQMKPEFSPPVSPISFSQSPMGVQQKQCSRRESLSPSQDQDYYQQKRPSIDFSPIAESNSDLNEVRVTNDENFEIMHNTKFNWYDKYQPPADSPASPILFQLKQQPLEERQKERQHESLPSSQQQQQKKPTNTVVSEQSSGTSGGFLGGITRGLLSKIKPQAHNEMRLPEDKNPKIIWDEHLGRYVDQEQKDQPQEELPPPPTSFRQQPLEQQKHVQEQPPPEQQIDFPFPLIPVLPPLPNSNASTATTTSRPFQGKARYANAWKS